MVDLQMAEGSLLIRRFAKITLHTGQRISDVCRIASADVVSGEIRVKQKKTGKELWIPLHPALQTELDGVAGPLLPNNKGKAFTSGTFRDVWANELSGEILAPIKAAGLVPRGLCKNAHSRLREAGLIKKQIQAITGRSPKMVDYYSKGADRCVQARAGIASHSEQARLRMLLGNQCCHPTDRNGSEAASSHLANTSSEAERLSLPGWSKRPSISMSRRSQATPSRLEWPPRSGTMTEFPEVDRAGWFSLAEADEKILGGQRAILFDFAERQARG